VKQVSQSSHRETLGRTTVAAGDRPMARGSGAYQGFRSYRRLLRWGLLATATVAVVVILLWPELKPSTTRIQMSAGVPTEAVPSDRDTAVDARFDGTDRYGRPFTITAPQAESTASDPDGLNLTSPVSDMTLADGRKVHLTADRGIYNSTAKIVDLFGNVVFIDDNGYRVETSKARINLDEALITGAEPVTGYASFGQVDGVGFRIVNSGEFVFVNGPARMRITSSPQLP
jgi:Uncharacterized protein conserved in bacteria